MKRDNYNIIVQGDLKDPSYGDGGDSAFSTGLMAWADSEQDIKLMSLFVNYSDLKIVRHPFQEKWNDTSLTSRDQVIAFFAGLRNINKVDFKNAQAALLWKSCKQYADSWMINKDIITPEVKLYLYRCLNLQEPLHIKLLGYPWAALRLLWNCYVKPNEELNQSIVLFATLGKPWLRLLVKLHPNLNDNLINYFCNWRDKTGMYLALNKKIKELGL